jgi:hypothetical protein
MKNWHEIQDVESLKQRFPFMFAGPMISMNLYKGWFPEIVRLCFDVDALLGDERHRFKWVEMEEFSDSFDMYFSFLIPPEQDEKYGTLFALRRKIQQTAMQRQIAIRAMCKVCGDVATAADDYVWITALCEFHTQTARHARGDFRPYYQLTEVPHRPGDDAGGAVS